jgi:hypothetical protein
MAVERLNNAALTRGDVLFARIAVMRALNGEI